MTRPDSTMLAGTGLVTLATARAVNVPGAAPTRRIPSLYADPVSWLMLEAVDELAAGCPDEVRTAAGTTAVVLVSAYSTTRTMSAIAAAVPTGRLSPLRFAGATAGGPVSLVCQAHGFRGPTLVITSAPQIGGPAAMTMAGHWVRTGAAGHVVIAVHEHDPERGDEIRCLLVGGAR